MPRQRTHHSRITHVFLSDFPQRLKRFQRESGLSWAEIARRPVADPARKPSGLAGKRGCCPPATRCALPALAELFRPGPIFRTEPGCRAVRRVGLAGIAKRPSHRDVPVRLLQEGRC